MTDPQFDETTATWQEIDGLIADLARLSQSAPSSLDFHTALVDRMVQALAAVGGAVWLRMPDDELKLVYQSNLSVDETSNPAGWRAMLAQQCLECQKPLVIAPRSGSTSQSELNASPYLLQFSPIRDGSATGHTFGVLEVAQRPGLSPQVQRENLRLLSMLCELAADFHKEIERNQLIERDQIRDRVDRFVSQIYSSPRLRATAHRIASEGRWLLQCDRVTVLTRHGRRFQIRAVSGVDQLDRRTPTAKRLEALVSAALRSGEPLWHCDGQPDTRPELEGPLHDYLDTSPARTIGVLPLIASDEPTADSEDAPIPREEHDDNDTHSHRWEEQPLDCLAGAVVVEQFAAQRQRPESLSSRALIHHGGLALHHALALDRVALLPRWRWLDGGFTLWGSGWLARTVLAAALILAVAGVLTFVEGDFFIHAPGQLQPMRRRDVFAASDGIVHQLLVKHDQKVTAGQPLAVLKHSGLELEERRIRGEIRTAQKRLAAVQAGRLVETAGSTRDRRRYAERTAEEESLKQELASLDAQLQIVDEQRSQLTVKSPIEGRVITWDIEGLLRARPVRRGHVLMTVADFEGPWILELDVPDRRAGHVLAAQASGPKPLEVEYILSASPETPLKGSVRDIAPVTDVNSQHEPAVRVTVDIDRLTGPMLQPGTTVLAKIHCGRRPLGYLWLHDFIDAFRTWVLF